MTMEKEKCIFELLIKEKFYSQKKVHKNHWRILNVKFGCLRLSCDNSAQLCQNHYMKTSQEILKIFITKIKEFMKNKNFNITQFAEFINVPTRTVSGWIANNRLPRIDYLCQIAECMNCSLDYLVGREDI